MVVAEIGLDSWVSADRRAFQNKQEQIRSAINGETGIINGVKPENKEDIFYMLMFCLCVPQSKAIKAEEAIEILRVNQFYTKEMSGGEIIDKLKSRVRFQNTKAYRLLEAKKNFEKTWQLLEMTYQSCGALMPNERFVQLDKLRNKLIQQINGMGMKLASHFLRNVGMSGLAILDVHILDGLRKRKIVPDKIVLSKQSYRELEEKMIDYAEKVGITLDELDLLLWSQKTGFVFK